MPPAQTLWNKCPQPGHCSASGAAGPPVSWRQTLQTWGVNFVSMAPPVSENILGTAGWAPRRRSVEAPARTE
eukprot:3643650-Alexandrium_andersonii.AAC.1